MRQYIVSITHGAICLTVFFLAIEIFKARKTGIKKPFYRKKRPICILINFQWRVPNVRVFSNTYRRLSESGIHHAEPAVNPGRHNVNVEEQILAAFEADPTISIRVVARVKPFDMESVEYDAQRKKYPFHGTGVQGLRKRIRRDGYGSAVLLNADIDDAWLLKSILWTDESKFSREGITNFHNLHEWADKDNFQ
ncbi:hypothetical protein JTB14_028728 [Gonioctena quinquepunctata]|nr:hypothetical protein JTB14_028728 [Gonioctena quinquepunctata]